MSSGDGLRIGLVGASGSIGGDLLRVLDQVPWRPGEVRAYARAATEVPFVSYGEDEIPVDDVLHADLADLDALIVAVPRDDAEGVVEAGVSAGVSVVDVSGGRLDDLDTPLVVPWINPEAFQRGRPRDVVSIPSAGATLLASVLGPWTRAGLGGRPSATVLLPANAWGRDAAEELSRQVISLFNASTPPRRVFPDGLAFDLLPQVGAPGATGWTGPELRTVAEVFRLTGARVDVSLVGVPVFAGVSATLTFTGSRLPEPEAVARVLAEGGVDVFDGHDARKLPRPRRVDGSSFARVARIRRAPDGEALHLWLAADNLRVTATAAAGATALLLRARGVLEAG